jgi:hypothetical protein
MSHLSTSLRSESEKYKKAARKINFDAMLRQYAPIGAVVFFFLIVLWWKVFSRLTNACVPLPFIVIYHYHAIHCLFTSEPDLLLVVKFEFWGDVSSGLCW